MHGGRRQRQRERQGDRLRAAGADADGPGDGRGRQLHGDVDERLRGDELQAGGEVGERELPQRPHRERHFEELRGQAAGDLHVPGAGVRVEQRRGGGWSSTDTTKVPPGAPTLTVPATDADGDYTASWTSVTGAMDYELEEKPSGGSFGNIYDDGGTSHDITGNTPGIYIYRARACAGTGNCGRLVVDEDDEGAARRADSDRSGDRRGRHLRRDMDEPVGSDELRTAGEGRIGRDGRRRRP